jgi:hypothetical protein
MTDLLSDRLRPKRGHRLRTSRGITACALTACVVVFVTAASKGPGATFVGLLIIAPLLWWGSWWILGMLRALGEELVRGRPPEVKFGWAWQGSASTRQQLRRDTNADIVTDRGGVLLRRRWWFIGSGTPPFEIPAGLYRQIAEGQEHEPQFLATWRDRTYWWYDDVFYWSTAGAYTSDDVKALLYARQRNQQRQLHHAHALLAASSSPAARKREPIPREVRKAVWQRDGGHCVECGSDFELQYDHVIPFAMGGASTVENLQLLCASCNRHKGAKL